jgi:hypothetical protein
MLNQLLRSWKALPRYEKGKTIFGGLLVVWAGVLITDMYQLKQDPRFQDKFGTK